MSKIGFYDLNNVSSKIIIVLFAQYICLSCSKCIHDDVFNKQPQKVKLQSSRVKREASENVGSIRIFGDISGLQSDDVTDQEAVRYNSIAKEVFLKAVNIFSGSIFR